MDQIYFWIIILFIIILFLDYCEKKDKKETFINTNDISNEKLSYVSNTSNTLNASNASYYEENRLNVFKPAHTSNISNTINYNNKNMNFRNFGISHDAPPFLKCPSCNLQFQCTDNPHDINTDNKNENVCHNCFEKTSYNSLNFPVYAKSVGKPRVCRNLK